MLITKNSKYRNLKIKLPLILLLLLILWYVQFFNVYVDT